MHAVGANPSHETNMSVDVGPDWWLRPAFAVDVSEASEEAVVVAADPEVRVTKPVPVGCVGCGYADDPP
jgi:hypothetical protein